MKPKGRRIFIMVNPDGTIRSVVKKAVREGEKIPMHWIEITDPKEKESLSPQFALSNYVYDDNHEAPSDQIKDFPPEFVSPGIKVIESPATPFDPNKLWEVSKVAQVVTEISYRKRVPYSSENPPKPTDIVRKVKPKPKIKILTNKTTALPDNKDTIDFYLTDVPPLYNKVSMKLGQQKFYIMRGETIQLTFDTEQTTALEVNEPRLRADPVLLRIFYP